MARSRPGPGSRFFFGFFVLRDAWFRGWSCKRKNDNYNLPPNRKTTKKNSPRLLALDQCTHARTHTYTHSTSTRARTPARPHTRTNSNRQYRGTNSPLFCLRRFRCLTLMHMAICLLAPVSQAHTHGYLSTGTNDASPTPCPRWCRPRLSATGCVRMRKFLGHP